MRSSLRWVLVTMLAFGLGALFIAFGLYIPTRQKLDIANADLEHANAMITGNIDQIITLQTDNEARLENLNSATLRRISQQLSSRNSSKQKQPLKRRNRFVNEPLSAVQQANAPVSEVIEQITQMFANEHSSLEDQWNQGNDVSTGDLRKALQRYRSFFNRLVV